MKTIRNRFQIRSAAPNQTAGVDTIKSALQLKESRARFVCLLGREKAVARPARPDSEVESRQGFVDGCISPLGRLRSEQQDLTVRLPHSEAQGRAGWTSVPRLSVWCQERRRSSSLF